jgi:transcriptional regulator GlxA family with amidase domain
MKIAVLLYEGFDELDAVGPYETFATAAERGADLEVSLVTREVTDRVVASHGLRVEPDGVLGEPDLLVVPGGGWSARDERGTWGEYERNDIPPVLAEHHEAGATLASVCTGAMLLERAGLLDGRPAVTHASALSDLRETQARVAEDADGAVPRVVDDGDVLTAGGVTSGIDLALWLLEREFDADVADGVATTLEYERRNVLET